MNQRQKFMWPTIKWANMLTSSNIRGTCMLGSRCLSFWAKVLNGTPNNAFSVMMNHIIIQPNLSSPPISSKWAYREHFWPLQVFLVWVECRDHQKSLSAQETPRSSLSPCPWQRGHSHVWSPARLASPWSSEREDDGKATLNILVFSLIITFKLLQVIPSYNH